VTAIEPAPAIERTRRWLERLVIGLGLCPFAAAPYRQRRIVYRVCEASSTAGIYSSFLDTLEALVLADPLEQETALLIVTHGLADFSDYLEQLTILEQAVADAGLSGMIQLASFHPDYRFADAPPDDPANFSNRSPFPMFHLIREDGLAAALESYPEPERIPDRNIRRLRELGVEGIRDLLDRE
jgi:hypothetical protein